MAAEVRLEHCMSWQQLQRIHTYAISRGGAVSVIPQRAVTLMSQSRSMIVVALLLTTYVLHCCAALPHV